MLTNKKAPGKGLQKTWMEARAGVEPTYSDLQSGTLDLNLGKVALYQLSYSRVISLEL
ncbi:hypothetical protein [Polaromonas sp.]|uniref:hypothetical protein n=1 Tax=Polaromonas sp. TaxID=1869339 RepID=UPI002CB6164D|nr:hypothetical protein [Polaromonas sp.]HQS00254.1 hypothetical protein [Polaromonas sp.]HQS41695.1 hypothetical protein [Polaromonas sp.]